MKTYSDLKQGDVEWFAKRAGIVTASEADALISPTFKIRDSKGVDSYLARKLAEKWIGGALPSAQMAMPQAMEFGSILESEARPFYELLTGNQVQQVGLITDDFETVGCSPDGLIGDDCGIEIKCPQPETHVKYLLAGRLPEEYILQVHFSMFVTNRPKWVFMSYRRGMPALILEIHRDDKNDAVIAEAVAMFSERMAAGWRRLVELNDDKPPVKPKTVAEVLAEENYDVIP